jgi:Asp-tRNA(Asn)/Glu-tRNA(Gln) amidotransferase C subunit
MEKIMPLDLLSSIKGARSSEAVDQLFEVIRNAAPGDRGSLADEPDVHVVSIDALRSDEVENCPEAQKEVIRGNFPGERNGYLVVPKVIED